MIHGQWSSVTITTDTGTVDLTPFVKRIEIEPVHEPDPWGGHAEPPHPPGRLPPPP